MGWLLEAEESMPEIFKAGGIGADSKAMDEIYHYIMASDLKRAGVPEHKIVNFARERVPAHSRDAGPRSDGTLRPHRRGRNRHRHRLAAVEGHPRHAGLTSALAYVIIPSPSTIPGEATCLGPSLRSP